MGQSAVDCGNLSSMPRVSFTIGGQVFDLAPEEVDAKIVASASACRNCLHLIILLKFMENCMLV